MDEVKPEWVDDQGEEDGPPMPSEAEMRASLLRSRQQIAEGRTVPLSEVLDRMRGVAKRIRADREALTERTGTDTDPAFR